MPPDSPAITLVANLTGARQPMPEVKGRALLDSADARFGGPGHTTPLAPYQAVLFEG